jgi:GTP-binding protein HflX
MATIRETKRAGRRERRVPSVAIAGYTNAGKSSLINRLTGAGLLVENALFATLDTTTRRARAADGRVYTISDTVGFVRHLPHQLVEAFRSTLEEVAEADLVLHVVDASAPEEELDEMLRAVDDVLEEIGAGDRPRLLVLNKADALDAERRRELSFRHPEGVLVSALTGEGLEALGERIAEEFERTLRDVELLLPYAEGGRLAELHDVAGDLEREDTPEGVRVRARVPVTIAERFAPFSTNGQPA